MSYQTPHGDKLRALSENDKLPSRDRSRVRAAITQYEAWIDELDGTRGTGEPVTSIEEVIILRKAKRLSANLRQNFASATGRAAARNQFERFLSDHPFAPDAFTRFLSHVEPLLGSGTEDEGIALERGWF